ADDTARSERRTDGRVPASRGAPRPGRGGRARLGERGGGWRDGRGGRRRATGDEGGRRHRAAVGGLPGRNLTHVRSGLHAPSVGVITRMTDPPLPIGWWPTLAAMRARWLTRP